MFGLIKFITDLFQAGELAKESSSDEEPHTIPASDAKKMWQNKVGSEKMKTSQNGLNLIESFEGFKEAPYLDSKGIPTIGIGSTRYENGDAVTMNDSPISRDRAFELLSFHLAKDEDCINLAVKVNLTQGQFDALACFTYNVGEGNFLSSTLLKNVNVQNFTDAAEQFLRWDRAGGVEIPGLLRRRQAERSLFLS